MRPTHGQVCKSSQKMAREFCGLEAQEYSKGVKLKGRHFGSSGRIPPDKRNGVSSCLLLVGVVYYNRPGKLDK